MVSLTEITRDYQFEIEQNKIKVKKPRAGTILRWGKKKHRRSSDWSINIKDFDGPINERREKQDSEEKIR